MQADREVLQAVGQLFLEKRIAENALNESQRELAELRKQSEEKQESET